ncbi:MAG: cupin-like domain-containing protein [Pseudomonadota bacterium]
MPFANPAASAKPAQKPRQVAFDPAIAKAVAERLVVGLSDEIVCLQLRHMADDQVIRAYIREAKNNPFYQGAAQSRAPLLKRSWILESQAELWRRDPSNRQIPVRENLAPEEFYRDYFNNYRPVLVKGWIDHWPAMTLWDTDYLEAKIGRDTPVQLQKDRDSRPDYEAATLYLREKIPFGDIADHLRSGKPSNDMYVTANNGAENVEAFKPIWPDFEAIDGIIKERTQNDSFVWIGPAGTVTPFHHDLTNNLLIQVKGRKEVVLVPSWEEAHMHTNDRFFSSLTPADMSFSDSAKLAAMKFVIGPGDALFIPVGWWHHIVSLEESYSVLFTNFMQNNDFSSSFPEETQG